MKQEIEWQTGNPIEEGYYLVTDSLGYVHPDYWGTRINEGEPYYCWSFYTGNKRVLAWYPVSGFEPYKPKDDCSISFVIQNIMSVIGDMTTMYVKVCFAQRGKLASDICFIKKQS